MDSSTRRLSISETLEVRHDCGLSNRSREIDFVNWIIRVGESEFNRNRTPRARPASVECAADQRSVNKTLPSRINGIRRTVRESVSLWQGPPGADSHRTVPSWGRRQRPYAGEEPSCTGAANEPTWPIETL